MDKDVIADAFNEWMRRYIEEPDRYEREWKTIQRFNSDESEGVKPTYGVECANYLLSIISESKS